MPTRPRIDKCLTIINVVGYEVIYGLLLNKAKRNSIISLAYLDGYSQIEIAKYLGLSKSSISMIIREAKSGD